MTEEKCEKQEDERPFIGWATPRLQAASSPLSLSLSHSLPRSLSHLGSENQEVV